MRFIINIVILFLILFCFWWQKVVSEASEEEEGDEEGEESIFRTLNIIVDSSNSPPVRLRNQKLITHCWMTPINCHSPRSPKAIQFAIFSLVVLEFVYNTCDKISSLFNVLKSLEYTRRTFVEINEMKFRAFGGKPQR